jgi:hypothetical protein
VKAIRRSSCESQTMVADVMPLGRRRLRHTAIAEVLVADDVREGRLVQPFAEPALSEWRYFAYVRRDRRDGGCSGEISGLAAASGAARPTLPDPAAGVTGTACHSLLLTRTTRLGDPCVLWSFLPRNQSAVIQQFEPSSICRFAQATNGITPNADTLD